MQTIKDCIRLIQIIIIISKYRLFRYVNKFSPKWYIKFIVNFLHFIIREKKIDHDCSRIRLCLIELGPIYVKFGQLLSTRVDLLLSDIASDLAMLQDKVPPFPNEQAIDILSHELKSAPKDVFTDFNPTPIASASISQVYSAKIEDEEVVIKILRPNIFNLVNKDIQVLKLIASWLEYFVSDIKRFKPTEIVKEIEDCILKEIDLRKEASNATHLRKNFQNSPLLYVPKVYWEYTTSNILVLEKLTGIAVNDIDSLKKHNINLQRLSERGVEIFFTQVFRDCFFHADMHPGNVWVSSSNGDNPQYLALDFGIMGVLSPTDQQYLAENFLAFFNRDYRKVAELHIESGWVPRNTRLDEFESAIRMVCEPIFAKPLKDISFGNTLLNLFTVAREFNMEVQPQLVLLQKTLISVEGLGRQLYPDLDLWVTAKPFLEKWLKDRVMPRAIYKRIRKEVPFWLDKLPKMPGLFYQTLKVIESSSNSKLETKTYSRKDIITFYIIGVASSMCGMIIFNILV